MGKEDYGNRRKLGCSYCDFLVGLHAIQHHLDDLAPQLYTLLHAVLGVGQVEQRGAACHLDVFVILVALEGCDHQLQRSNMKLQCH